VKGDTNEMRGWDLIFLCNKGKISSAQVEPFSVWSRTFFFGNQQSFENIAERRC
jgi:hypothetical protein